MCHKSIVSEDFGAVMSWLAKLWTRRRPHTAMAACRGMFGAGRRWPIALEFIALPALVGTPAPGDRYAAHGRHKRPARGLWGLRALRS